ncbi:MAG TPA: flagellar hook-length control protein FliK [Lacipirellulaceae bacterium]|nr:flagellar hook-length control protein FliK [Lacipirellulaceae bacterium]
MPPFASESATAAAFKPPSSPSRLANKGSQEPATPFASFLNGPSDFLSEGNDDVPPKPPMRKHSAASSPSRDESTASKIAGGNDKTQPKGPDSDGAQKDTAAKPANAKSSESTATDHGKKSDHADTPEETKSSDDKPSDACKHADATVPQVTANAIADPSSPVPQAVATPPGSVMAAPVVLTVTLPASIEQTTAKPDNSAKSASIGEKGNAAKQAGAAQVTLQARVRLQPDASDQQDASIKSSGDNPKTTSGPASPGPTQAAAGSGERKPIQSRANSVPDGIKIDGSTEADAGVAMNNGGPNAVNTTNSLVATTGGDAKNASAQDSGDHTEGAAEIAPRGDSAQPMLPMRFDGDVHLTDITGSQQSQLSQQIQVQQSAPVSNPSAPTAVLTPAAVPIAGLAVEIAGRALAGKTHFEIRLDPPELGRIDVHLSVDRDGQVTSHLVVDRTDTLNLLRQDSTGLERALQNAGLTTSGNGLQFSLRDQTMNQNPLPQPVPPTPSRVIVPDDTVAGIDVTPRIYSRLSGMGGGLDIRV